MTVLLLILGFVLLLIGLAGLILPAVPGGPFLFAGVLAIAWAEGFVRIGWPGLVAVGFLAVLISVTDYAAQVLGARRSGASWWGLGGALAGLLAGLPFGFPGLVIGPVLGAFVLEWLRDRDFERARRVGWGTFLGFVIGTAVKYALAFALIGTAALAWWL